MNNLQVQTQQVQLGSTRRSRKAERKPGLLMTPADDDAINTVKHLITEPTLVSDETGTLRVIYLQPDLAETAFILNALKRIEFIKGWRTSGLPTSSKVFGFQPRVVIRKDYCAVAALSRDYPSEHRSICTGAAISTAYLARYAPLQYETQTQLLRERVRPEWVLPGGAFTSGIANYNNQLFYHFDTGNFPKLWSAMYVYLQDMEGGCLVMPQLDVAFKFKTGSLIMFDGQSFIHAVTPLKKRSPSAFRYSVVYYALQGMCHCMSPVDELARIQTVKTGREHKRLRRTVA